MTDQEDVRRKVQGLMRLAADEGNNEHERAAAEQKAIALRLKHGISDDDLAGLEEDDEFIFFGHRMFFFVRHIQPHLIRIKDEIDRALAKADALDLLNKATTYSRVYKEIRQMVEGSYYTGQLKARRDVVVKEYYQSVADDYATDHGGDVSATMQHEWARDRTASACDLRKDTVERIVGITSQAIWMKEMRSIVCERCGLDGNEKRQVCDLYEVDGERIWRHPACHEEAEASSTG